MQQVKSGDKIKVHYHGKLTSGETFDKSDPFAFFFETPPKTASIVWSPKYEWKDENWLKHRKSIAGKPKPYSVYEVHYGSWRRKEDNFSLSYPEMAIQLVEYVRDMGFTHVEFLPIMEHPFFGS